MSDSCSKVFINNNSVSSSCVPLIKSVGTTVAIRDDMKSPKKIVGALNKVCKVFALGFDACIVFSMS